MKNGLSGLLLAVSLFATQAGTISPVPDKIAPAVADRQRSQVPDRVHLSGWVGSRIDANEANRLVKLDAARLLEGYRKRPGRQAWDGEHVGKWLHAATLAWVNTGDPALRTKLDYIVEELIKCQLDDGYLGTYLDKDRWTEWDVWAHKYNLIGLLTYMRYTGNTKPLEACRRMGDLLCNTFGDEPGKRDIIKAGHHVGLAPTSVLEPMVLLYRFTGEPRYLEFCKYIFRAWEQPNGPKVISTLLKVGRVDKVGNGKAYEMLSCLNGALEYYRTMGGEDILKACENAWNDIVEKRLYITGTASYHEVFHDDYDLPNVSNVGETCVTVTWLQFNAQLLRLTGAGKYAEQLERVVLNQLFGAQRCDGTAWGYYVQMEGKKPYSSTLDGHCCLSSGPRGVALIPTFAVTTDNEGIVVNLYDQQRADLKLNDQTEVILTSETLYPSDGRISLTVSPEKKKEFTLKLRIPSWTPNTRIQVAGKSVKSGPVTNGYLPIRRVWKKGDKVEVQFELAASIVVGDHKNAGKVAVMYGPLVLAADEALFENAKGSVSATTSPGSNEKDKKLPPMAKVSLSGTDLKTLQLKPEPAPSAIKTWSGAQVFRVNGAVDGSGAHDVRLIPFADAGGTGTQYKVWLDIEGSK